MACPCCGGLACGAVCSACGFTGADLCVTIEAPGSAYLSIGPTGPATGLVACLLNGRTYRVPWVGGGWSLRQRLPGCGLTDTDSNHPVLDLSFFCESCTFRGTRGVYRNAMRVIFAVSSASQYGGGTLVGWPEGATPGNAPGVPAYFALPCNAGGGAIFDGKVFWNGSAGAGNDPPLAGRMVARPCGGTQVATRDTASILLAGLGSRPQPASEFGAPQTFAALAATPPPPCRFRSEDAALGSRVRAAGLSTQRAWYDCQRPGFERLGLLVAECGSYGVPAGRQCGSLARCTGYVASDPQSEG